MKRQICAEDKCKVVEGEPECFEKVGEYLAKNSGENGFFIIKFFIIQAHFCLKRLFHCKIFTLGKAVENTVKVPEETCSMEPNTECRNVTVR